MIIPVHGQCLCGGVLFSTESESLWCAHCHCTLCQIAHGAAFVTWVGYKVDSVQIQGTELTWFKSSDEGERGFCRECGTTLFFRSSQWPAQLHIARGLIQDDIDRLPEGHAFYDTHVNWVSTDDDLLTT